MIPLVQRILYATDLDGAHTRPVFKRAVSLARRYEAKLLMVHIVEPLGATGSAVLDNYLPKETVSKILKGDGMHEVLVKMKDRLQKFAREELKDETPDRIPDIEAHVAYGKPSRELLRIAEENNIDVIVMGKSAGSFLGNAMLGTTARRVTRYSKIPVYLVPNNL